MDKLTEIVNKTANKTDLKSQDIPSLDLLYGSNHDIV